MNEFIDDLKFILKDYGPDHVDTAAALMTAKNVDFDRTRVIAELSADKQFLSKFFQIFFSGDVAENYKLRIIEILAFFGTIHSLTILFKIYYSLNVQTLQAQIDREKFKEAIKKTLKSYKYRYIDEFVKLQEVFKTSGEILSLIEELIETSGYYRELFDFLEYPSEKVTLYVLKQFYKAPHIKILPALVKIRKDSNWMVRFNIVQVLKQLKDVSANELMLSFLADDNIKVRDEVRTFVKDNFNDFSKVIFEVIDYPEKAKNMTYLESVIEIFSEFPDESRLTQVINIIKNFPELVSLRARSALLKIIRRKCDPGVIIERSGQAYEFMKISLLSLKDWRSDQQTVFINKILELCGNYYIDILIEEYFKNHDEHLKNLMPRLIYKGTRWLDKEVLLNLFNFLDFTGKDRYIKYLLSQNFKDIISYFSKAIENLSYEKLLELYRVFVLNSVDVSSITARYHANLRSLITQSKFEAIEILASLNDKQLLDVLNADWKIFSAQLKDHVFNIIEKYYNDAMVLPLLNQIYYHEHALEFKIRVLNIIARINCSEATELIIKAASSTQSEIRDIALKMLIEKGRDRFFNQLNSLPEEIREQFGMILIKGDKNFISDLENQLTTAEPKLRAQILKMLTYLIKGDRVKVLNLIKKFIKDPDPHIRAELTKILGIVGGTDIIEILAALVNDENARVRANSIEIIGLLNVQGLSNLIFPMTTNVNNRVRANAIIALYKMGNKGVVIALSEMLKSKDKWMRASAAYALGEINDPRTLPLLETLLNDQDVNVVINVLRVFKKIGDDDTLKKISKYLNHENKEIRVEASATISAIKKKENLL
ncbi:MAG: HEAT repeat domain-containing protein [Candidatus Wallbacteria bacterium]